jgi:microcystin degradation protein MlrC
VRIGILGFAHESNTFVSVPTTLQRFSEGGIHRGKGIIDRWKGSHHELGGFIAGSEANGFVAVPLMYSSATPGGPLTDTAFETILGEMIGLLEKDEELDGLLLALHGAMVAEGYSDADGEIVSRIREVFGDKPIVMTLDCHANVSSKMVDNVTATILYRTNPHVDQRERGLEAAGLIARTVRGQIHPVQALEKPPMVVNISKQYTGRQPARGLIQDAERVMRQPGVLSASVGLGFAFADTEKMGASFIVVADGDVKRARRQARWMARRAWDRRSEFLGDLPSPAEAVRKAAVSPVHPVVLMDVGDNVGGGSPADSTILLKELVHQRVNDGLIVLRDPEAVERCVRAGVGNELTLDVGGKSDDKHGQPVCIRGRVRTLSDGKFVDERPRHGGQRFYDQGTTAVVETPERHTIVLTSLRMPPFSLEQILSLGIKPENKRVIVVKGVIAPRAAYEPIAKEIITVDTPGSTSANLMHFEYRHRRRPLYPFEAHAAYLPMSE